MPRALDLEDTLRLLTGLIAAAVTGWLLADRGWPLVQVLPAAILAFFAMCVIWALIWYLRRKFTYNRTARRVKADLRQGGDGWPEEHDHRRGQARH